MIGTAFKVHQFRVIAHMPLDRGYHAETTFFQDAYEFLGIIEKLMSPQAHTVIYHLAGAWGREPDIAPYCEITSQVCIEEPSQIRRAEPNDTPRNKNPIAFQEKGSALIKRQVLNEMLSENEFNGA